MDAVLRPRFRPLAARVTFMAHFFGIMAAVLIVIWLLHYRGGLDLDSNNNDRVFNVHPFLMYFGFLFMMGEAMMAYRTVAADRKVQKFFHSAIHLVAITMGIIGIYAAFKFHDKVGLSDMYSLHSWIGMGTFCLYCLQWVFGFFAFWFPKASPGTRERMLPWHIFGGRALLFLGICAAVSGLMEKSTYMQLQHGNESRLMNFAGLFILLFGVTVDLSLALGF